MQSTYNKFKCDYIVSPNHTWQKPLNILLYITHGPWSNHEKHTNLWIRSSLWLMFFSHFTDTLVRVSIHTEFLSELQHPFSCSQWGKCTHSGCHLEKKHCSLLLVSEHSAFFVCSHSELLTKALVSSLLSLFRQPIIIRLGGNKLSWCCCRDKNWCAGTHQSWNPFEFFSIINVAAYVPWSMCMWNTVLSQTFVLCLQLLLWLQPSSGKRNNPAVLYQVNFNLIIWGVCIYKKILSE